MSEEKPAISYDIKDWSEKLFAIQAENEKLKIGMQYILAFFQVAVDALGIETSCEPGKIDPMCTADAIRGLKTENKELEALCREFEDVLRKSLCRCEKHENILSCPNDKALSKFQARFGGK